MFYKITLLRKETVCPDFAEATEDSQDSLYCRGLSSQMGVLGERTQGCLAP